MNARNILNNIIQLVVSFLCEMQRIAFRLLLSICVCVCVFVCVCVYVYAAFVDARKTV